MGGDEHHGRGENGEDRERHRRAQIRREDSDVVVDAEGDRLERAPVQQGEREYEVTPAVQEREKRDGDDGRPAHRQDDPDERAPFGGAVHPGGLQDVGRQAEHERAHDQDAERHRVARVGQDQARVGVQQVELVVDDEQTVSDHN